MVHLSEIKEKETQAGSTEKLSITHVILCSLLHQKAAVLKYTCVWHGAKVHWQQTGGYKLTDSFFFFLLSSLSLFWFFSDAALSDSEAQLN